MRIKLYLSFVLLFCGFVSTDATAQFTQVFNTSGTTSYGGTAVTVTANGAGAQVYNEWCGAGPYWIGANSQPGSFTFTFSPSVTGVIFEFTAMNFDELLWVEVNGSPFSLGPCNLSAFDSATCGESNTEITNGEVTSPVDISFGANGTVTLCGNFTSVTFGAIGAGNGTVFSTYFTTDPCSLQGGGGTVTAGSNSPLCQGETLNLTATASGGSSFSWTGPNSFTSTDEDPVITNVTPAMAGQYIVTSTGDCGTAIDTVNVQITPGPAISFMNSNSPVCEGQTLNLFTNLVTNAVYSWTGPNTFVSNLQNPTIAGVTPLATGDYILTISVNNCTSDPDTLSVVIDPLPAAPGVVDVNYCVGDVATPLTASGNGLNWYFVPTGGSPLPGAPTPNTSIAGVTTYYVAATGPGPTNCEGPRSPIVVTVYPHPGIPQISYKNSYCANEAFVPFTVVVGQNIQYYDQPTLGTPLVDPPVVDPTVPGTYQWYATQTVNGCESAPLAITIIVHPYIEANFSYAIKYGCKEDTVVLTNASIGATGYLWNFGDGSATDNSVNPTHIYANQGIDTITLISSAPYCRDTFQQSVDLNHPLSASFTTDVDTICQHQAITFTNTSVTTTINGITPTYTWNFGDGTSDNNEHTVHTYDVTGAYTIQLVVTDFVPCNAYAWKSIYVDSSSALSMISSDSMLCAGQAVSFEANYSDIGLLGVTWDYGDGILEYDKSSVRHTYEQAGTYIIKVSTDYRICRDTSAELQVTLKPFPILNLGPDTSMCPTAGPLVLNDLINGGNPAASWLWNTGDRNFAIEVKQPGRYSAAVTIDGCSTSDSVWVKKDCYLDIPNSFTPDGDGLNDYFLPRQLLSEGVKAFKMHIYNRWGQEIYSTTKLDGRGWDGRFNGELQPQGVYVYLIEVTFRNGTAEKKQGNVTLLR